MGLHLASITEQTGNIKAAEAESTAFLPCCDAVREHSHATFAASRVSAQWLTISIRRKRDRNLSPITAFSEQNSTHFRRCADEQRSD
ncbi:hypothetical protein [Methylobacterium sp. NFXW15]|uniref:hypothetical protein n=1 Tax=Methylobacterium sp. NFXW15 TaxID=2819512 RepID=UPI003CF29F6E